MTALLLGRTRGLNSLSQSLKNARYNSVGTVPPRTATLQEQLRTRQLPLIYDYLSPQSSHLLNLSLKDVIPRDLTLALDQSGSPSDLPSILRPCRMPPGHHLVYFPPQLTLSQLLADGTDILHSPGEPFTRRLWAGGSVKFPSEVGLLLNGQRAVCVENIRDVMIKGAQGDEKVIVGIERQIFGVEENADEEYIRGKLLIDGTDNSAVPHIIETRNLVFLRDKNGQTTGVPTASQRRYIKPPINPQYSCKLTPPEALLFRYSALTFNAHSIHLDKLYTTQTEGYHNLLVHGPLTLTLVLTVFQQYTANMGFTIAQIEYRNLAPLFVGEEMTICIKPNGPQDQSQWDIWIEGPEGELTVRGTIHTNRVLK